MNKIENAINDLNMYEIDTERAFGLKPTEVVNFRNLINSFLASQEMKSATKILEISELIVQNLYKNNNFYSIRNDEKEEIWMYKDGIYIPNGKSYIQEFCRCILDKAYTSSITKRIFEKIIADNYINEEDFFGGYGEDPNIEFVPVTNGLLNIFTRELIPFDSKRVFFSKLPVKYTPAADCPKIKKFVSEIVEEERDINVIQELFGYVLLRDYRFERAFMFLGGGRNGKSKLAELMKIFVGAENVCSLQPVTFEDPNNPNVSTLHTKQLNLCMDINSTQLKNTSILKGLTGGDLITAPRKYKTAISFKNYAKMIFGANELPATRDIKDAFWERWILLQFPKTFVTETTYNAIPESERTNHRIKDEFIVNKLTTEEELEGLLIWALDGLQRLLKNKDFSYKYTPSEVKAIWMRKSDSVNAFVLDKCDVEYDYKVLKENFHREYVNYCKKNKIRVQSMKMITIKLEEQGVLLLKDRSGEYREYYDGLKFKDGIHQYFPKGLDGY
jgi:putative DNA primase/helicase